MTVISQKADVCPMGFRLEPLNGQVVTFVLPIRPEDLSYTATRLQAAIPTLDGAFVDDFGKGLTTIQISGHTGWGQGRQPPGEVQFANLSNLVWGRWSTERDLAVQQGRDPADVKLIFVDCLHQTCSLVAPQQFVLKRSKSRPLLIMYQMTMVKIGQADTPADPDSLNLHPSSGGVLAGLKSLAHTINQVADAITQVKSFVDAATSYPLAGILSLANGSMNSVLGLVGLDGIVSPQAAQMVNVAGDLVYASRNVLLSYSAAVNPSGYQAQQLSSTASACQDAYCVLTNTMKATETYPDYTGLYGASSCSSTVGGSPLSAYLDINPWTVVGPTVDSVAAITPAARDALSALKAADPVLAAPSASQLRNLMSTVNAGVTLLK